MALNYNIEDIIACIEVMHPILADTIANAALDRLIELGFGEDAFACKWSNTPPRSCNSATILKVIADTAIIGDLQWIQACAEVVSGAIDEESTSSESSCSTSSEEDTSDSSAPELNCANYAVRTPRSFETESSTLGLIMELLEGNALWDDVIDNGDLKITILETRGGKWVPGNISVNESDGLVIYLPEQDGSEAGSHLNIRVLFSDTAGLCTAAVWIYIVVTEQTTTAVL